MESSCQDKRRHGRKKRHNGIAGKLYTVEKNAIFIVGWKDQCLR